jgi:hypothetical protein
MGRVDAEVEIVRRNNTAARYSPREIVLAGLDPRAEHAFDGRFPSKHTVDERARFLRQEIDRMRNDWLPKLRKQ